MNASIDCQLYFMSDALFSMREFYIADFSSRLNEHFMYIQGLKKNGRETKPL